MCSINNRPLTCSVDVPLEVPLDDHLALPLVRRDPGPEAGEGGQEPAEAADHRGGGPLCEVQVQVQVCVSPLESPHLLTTAPLHGPGPVVAHSYTRTGTPAHTGLGTSSASHSAQLTDETAANMNIRSDTLHMIRAVLCSECPKPCTIQHPVLY